MDSEKPMFHTTKLLTTWWDLVDHYLLAVMFAVSLASVGLQTTQDRLICIPAINCSALTGNDSVVRNCSELSDDLDICNRSSSFVVLTKMPDRRQYDYVDSECYKEIHRFSAYYSLIFLVEAVILLAISNFWQKYPNSASGLAHCEHLLSEFTKGDILVPKVGEERQQTGLPPDGEQQQEQKQAEQKLLKRLKAFEQCYSHKISKFNCSSVTGQYRLRGVLGIIVTIAALAVNICYYSLSTEFTQCHLDGHVAFSAEHRFFQCTRSMGTYFHVGSILLFVLLGLHLFLVLWSFVWSLTGERFGPVYKITSGQRKPPKSDGDTASSSVLKKTPEERMPLKPVGDAASSSGHEGTSEGRLLLTYEGDAAFLFYFIHRSNYSFVITVIRYLIVEEVKKGEHEKENKKENKQREQSKEKTEEQKVDNTPLACICCR